MKRILTIAAAVTLLAWQSMYGAPTKYLDVDVNWQQMQELETLHIQQGADMQLRVRPKLDGAWLTLTGLTARWEARQYATNAAAYSRASNLTSNQAHFIQMELTSAQTGTAYTNWIYSVILIEGAAEYPIGQGTVHVWPSAFAGSSAELVGSGYQTNGVAASPVSTVNFGTGISSTLVSNKLTLSVASGAGGDITGVTAGTWLSGGGSSGEVTVSADTNAVMDAVAGKGYLTAESDTAAIAALGVHTNLALAESGHGPELDPVWAAVSNTVIPGAAAGATALQAEADTLDAVTGRGQTTTRALGFSSDTTADSMIYHTQTDEILGAVAGPANLLSGGAYWLLYGASHALGPRFALNGNGGPVEIMSQTTMIEGNGVAYTNAGPIYSSDYYLDGTNITALWGGGSDGGATNITAGSSDSYNFTTRSMTWNTNAAAGSGGASARPYVFGAFNGTSVSCTDNTYTLLPIAAAITNDYFFSNSGVVINTVNDYFSFASTGTVSLAGVCFGANAQIRYIFALYENGAIMDVIGGTAGYAGYGQYTSVALNFVVDSTTNRYALYGFQNSSPATARDMSIVTITVMGDR